jgi:sigma-E factor negative regulatory protein RseC
MSGIVHKGIIRKDESGAINVELLDGLECESCSIKGSCQLGGTRDNVLKIDRVDAEYKEGEMVEVELSSGMAFGALFWAYIFPFIIMITGLIVMSNFVSEGIAGLMALAFLGLYYLGVYLNKQYFEKKFELKINRYD